MRSYPIALSTRLKILVPALVMASCSAGEPNTPATDTRTTQNHSPAVPITTAIATPGTGEQVSQYIRRMFRDKKGDLWLATTNDGVCKYDGNSFTYFTPKEGLSGFCVKSILEDLHGNMWFTTESGLSKFDGRMFTNYTTKDGLPANDCWFLLQDSSGMIWISTGGGVCCYDGKTFTPFSLPKPKIKNPVHQYGPDYVMWITEDKKGRIWFATDGFGVCRYDRTALTTGTNLFKHFTKKDGLNSNNMTCIMEDTKGNMWMGSKEPNNFEDGGVNVYDGKTFKGYGIKNGLSNNRAWCIYEDKNGEIWIATDGVAKFNAHGEAGTMFTIIDEKNGLGNTGVQSLLEDGKGNLLIGTGAGLFRYNGDTVVNVTKGMEI